MDANADAPGIHNIIDNLSDLTINIKSDSCWWWAFSRRDIWLEENKLDEVDPRDAWSAACFLHSAPAAEWLTSMRIRWEYRSGYICVRDPIGPWLRLRLMHYGAPPTSYAPIICKGHFAKIGTIRTARRDGAEYGRDVLHRSLIKINNTYILWDLPALISLEAVFYGDKTITYIFTLTSFIIIHVRIIFSDCVRIEQEIEAP